MKLEKRKKIEKRLATTVLAVGMFIASSLTALASSTSDTYSIFTLTCENSISSVHGTGKTGGVASPYYNKVIMQIYDSQNVCKYSDYRCGMAGVSAQISKWGLGYQRVTTYHCGTDPNYDELEPASARIQLDDSL